MSSGLLRYNKNLKSKSRQLRRNLTDSEQSLWFRLRGKQILGVQLYRQKPIGGYIVDFYAPKAKLVIEVDGSQHFMGGHVELDNQRDQVLAGLGLKVLRFNSGEVLTNTDEVVEVIRRAVTATLGNPPGPPLQKGGVKAEARESDGKRGGVKAEDREGDGKRQGSES